jgi:hypothetical protein
MVIWYNGAITYSFIASPDVNQVLTRGEDQNNRQTSCSEMEAADICLTRIFIAL